MSITQAYWLENKMEEGYFNVKDQARIGQPDVDAAYNASIELNVFGEKFTFVRPVRYKFTDPVKGEVYWPTVVIPSYTIKVVPEFVLWSRGKTGDEYAATYEKKYTSYKLKNSIRTVKELKDPTGQIRGYAKLDSVLLNRESASVTEKKIVHPHPQIDPNNGNIVLPVSLPNEQDSFFDNATKQRVNDIFLIKHDHIPAITFFKLSKANIKYINYSTYNKKIGYIVGAGDKVPDALDQMGYEVTLLTDKELSRNNLQQFDAIISGVRAYNTNEWLNKYYDKLMKYVNDGGNYIVQYNTSNFISSIKNKIGPYDFTIGRTRITDENSPVTFLKPEHPVLNFPNKITQDDFKEWVQERSIYHASNWDKKFESIFSMSDPGEKTPDEGSLIITKYGKGYFTYTGIVFFRELPAGVPGAYRLLANIVALNKKKAF